MKAFPQTRITINGDKDITTADLGMDLRDYFAAQAMPVIFEKTLSGQRVIVNYMSREIAKESYKLADAMMEAREKK